jgi:hypothetical protein
MSRAHALAALMLLPSVALAQNAEVTESQKCRPPAAGQLVEVSIAGGEELRALVSWASALTCRNFVYDADIADWEIGVEFYAAELPVEDAYRMFLVALRGSGLRVVTRGARNVIVPAKAATRKAAKTILDDGYVLPFPPVRTAERAAEDWSVGDGLHELQWTRVEELRGDPAEAILRSTRLEPIPVPLGVTVSWFRPGSAAERVGLQKGDIVHVVNNQPVGSVASLRDALATFRHGQTHSIQLSRGRRPVTLLVFIR